MGTPLHAPADFDLGKRLREAEELRAAMDAATTSDATIATQPGDPDEPTLLAEGIAVPDSSADNIFADVGIEATPVLPASPTPETPVTNAKLHMRSHRNARRRAKRAKEAEKIFDAGEKPIKQASLKHLQNAAALHAQVDVQSTLEEDACAAPTNADAGPISTDFAFGDMKDHPVTSNAFVGKLFEQSEDDKRTVPISELRDREGWQYVPWDGRCVVWVGVTAPLALLDVTARDRTCRPILDRNGIEFANLIGQPAWGDLNAQLMKILETARSAYTFSKKDVENRRGEFPSVACGISFGGGQKVRVSSSLAWACTIEPMRCSQRVGNLAHTPHNREVWNAMFKLVPMRRVASFVDRKSAYPSPRDIHH